MILQWLCNGTGWRFWLWCRIMRWQYSRDERRHRRHVRNDGYEPVLMSCGHPQTAIRWRATDAKWTTHWCAMCAEQEEETCKR